MVLISSNLEVRFTQIKCLVKKVFVDVLTNFYQCDTAKVLWEEAINRENISIRMACSQIYRAFP